MNLKCPITQRNVEKLKFLHYQAIAVLMPVQMKSNYFAGVNYEKGLKGNFFVARISPLRQQAVPVP